MQNTFYSNGKLLLTAEYVVLDGAKALALPTKKGQTLRVFNIEQPHIIWESINEKGEIWYKDEFIITKNNIESLVKNNNSISTRLTQILNTAKTLNPRFLTTKNGYKVVTTLDFNKNWGLGSSSTLLNNIAQWAKVDAFKLSNLTFGGSGYDIACAQNNTPILYSIKKQTAVVTPIVLKKSFQDHLFFVHLNRKQNSRDAIKTYQNNKKNTSVVIKKINTITSKIIEATTIKQFENLLEEHENLIGEITKQTPIKQRLFKDYNGQIKSLGGWNGDFVLVTGDQNYVTQYFNKNGYHTIINYNNMIL